MNRAATRKPILLMIALLVVSLLPVPARALDRDVKSVLVAGMYGIAGGTILGLASYPFSQNPRNIAIGSSVGLYLGIAIGFYFITHRDDPGNPLNIRNEPRSYREESLNRQEVGPVSPTQAAAPKPWVEAKVTVYRF